MGKKGENFWCQELSRYNGDCNFLGICSDYVEAIGYTFIVHIKCDP